VQAILSSLTVRRLDDTLQYISRLVSEIVASQQPLLHVGAAPQLCKTVLSRSPQGMGDGRYRHGSSLVCGPRPY
jgi:hypothetical protein